MSLVAATSLTSCNNADAVVPDTSFASMVSIDDDGTTNIFASALKSGYEGDGTEISQELAEWLQFMREEEKLARDVYLALYSQYNVPVFKNISKAEQNHMDAVLVYLNDYGIEDLSLSNEGEFHNEHLQELYNELTEKGAVSLVEALKVGALIEEVDIIDLVEVYEMEPGEDIIALAEALMLGSRNHLRAFTRVLGFQDVDYEPVFLSMEAYEEIINTGWERGTGLCRNIDTEDGKRFENCRGRGFWRGR